MRKLIVFYALVVSLSCVYAHAQLNFMIDCDAPVISVGEQTTIDICVWETEAAADQGVIGWQFDIRPSEDAKVQVVSWSVDPVLSYFSQGPTSEDTPVQGAVNGFQAASFASTSNVGVGGYTKIASITIEGLSAGEFQYTVGDFTTLGFYGFVVGDVQLDGNFIVADSVVNYEVVPEPSSLLVLSGLGMIGYLRRNKR